MESCDRTNTKTDISIIKMIAQIKDSYHKKGLQDNFNCLLLEEKLIYTIIACTLEDHDEEFEKQIPSLHLLLVNFVQKVNKIAMQNFQQQTEQESKQHEKLINKAVALLMMPQIEKKFNDQAQLKKLKIISFSNLSCLFKKRRKFGVALRAISYAVELQQQLMKSQANQQKYDIVQTYFNKAAIYSQMKKHTQALQIILKARSHIQYIQRQLMLQIEGIEQFDLKKRLLQKRYYGLSMKMLIFYNIGVEKEHLHQRNQAIQYYKQSKQVATIIDNQLMIAKLTRIIADLMQK